MTISRRSFLWGVGCAAVGAVAGTVGTSIGGRPRRRFVRGEDSYSQCGEDRIVLYMLREMVP
ncbi:MAG: twin-arginine translocation signal domain-containing protein, partial [Singulisphaera sp.]